MSVSTLTLIVPGLLDAVAHLDKIPAQELPRLASFSRLLSRGKLRYFGQTDYYTFLFNTFAIDPQNSNYPATAPVDYYYQHLDRAPAESLQEKRWIMRADPCFMAPDRDQLVLVESAQIDLTYDEAARLVDEINTFFQPYAEEDFWQLELSPKDTSPLSWFLTSSKPISFHSCPTSLLKGRPIKAFLPQADHQSGWLKLFNEFQMVLHQSEVNTQRRLNAQVPINSVWFWGSGQSILADESTCPATPVSVYSNDPVVKGLAELVHFNNHDLPHNSDELFMVKSMGNAIVIMDHLAESVRNADVYGWIDLSQQFEKDWLVPIANALRNGQLHQLILQTPAGTELKVNRRNLNAWWKRHHHFTRYTRGAVDHSGDR